MTIGEVLAWQENFISQGNHSSAVGKYQIINTTLMQLVEELGIDKAQKYDPKMQDKLAIALLERRGSNEYINKELSREELAANLAKEWAALPKVLGSDPSSSYYAGDGLNKSRVEISEVLQAIDHIQPR